MNRLKQFYSRYDVYFTAGAKFLVAFLMLCYLSHTLGYLSFFNQIPVLLIVAACCSFLPGNVTLLAGAVCLEGHLFGWSLAAAVAGGIGILVVLLVYFSFLSRQSYVVLLTILALGIGMPAGMPIACGLLLGPGGAGGILVGTVMYYFAAGLCQGTPVNALGEELLLGIQQGFVLGLTNQKLILELVILISTFLVVYLIRRLPSIFSWYAAVASGIVVYLLLSVIAMISLPGELAIRHLMVDVLLGTAAGLGIRFFCFKLDYKKTEYLEFEDDEYYYYVKAVPKRETEPIEPNSEKEIMKE